MSVTLHKWNTSIKNFEEAVELFDKIASTNLDESQKQLEDIKSTVHRELENLKKYTSYAEIRHQQLSEPKCCDPIPRMVKQVGCILSFATLVRVLSVAFLAFFDKSLTVEIVSFVLYGIGEIVGTGGEFLTFQYGLEVNNIDLVSKINHEKLEDFQQFEKVLNNFSDFQKFITVIKYSTKNNNNDSMEDVSSMIPTQRSHLNSSQETTSSSSISNSSEDLSLHEALPVSNPPEITSASTTILMEEDKNEVSIPLHIPHKNTTAKIDKMVSKCLKSYQKLPEKFHSDETESYLFSNMVQKYPSNDFLIESFENIIGNDDDDMIIEKINHSTLHPSHVYIKKTPSKQSLENLEVEKKPQGDFDNISSRKNSSQLIQATSEQIKELTRAFKIRFNTRKLPQFIKLPSGTVISLKNK